MNLEDYMLPCLNKKVLGIDCPGCGIQRSFSLLIKGEFSEAFFMFPAIYTTLLFLVVVFLHFFLNKKITSKIIITLAVFNVSIIIISYIIKMKTIFIN